MNCGDFVALAAPHFANPPFGATFAMGGVSALLVALGFLRHQAKRWGKAEAIAPPRFGTVPGDG